MSIFEILNLNLHNKFYKGKIILWRFENMEEKQEKKRWYDKYEKTTKILDFIKDFSDEELEMTMAEVLQTAMTVKKTRSETELISLGIKKIKGIMHSENKQRWYDKNRTLYIVMNSLSAMKEDDFKNIIDALYESLYQLD